MFVLKFISFSQAFDPEQSFAYGPGLQGGIVAGAPTHFTIEPRGQRGEKNASGNPFSFFSSSDLFLLLSTHKSIERIMLIKALLIRPHEDVSSRRNMIEGNRN